LKNKYGNYKSKLARKIVIQYAITFIGFFIAYVVLLLAAAFIYSSFSFQATSLVYQTVQLVKAFPLFFLGFPIFLGWLVITTYFLLKPLRYMDEVVSATEQLYDSIDEPVVLSNELKDVQDELNYVREQSRKNAAIAKKAEKRKNDLIVYLAHDLKTPLSSVIGYLNLLKDEQQISDELREKYLSISLDKAERLEDLINEFFEITRFNLSNITLEYRMINLTRMLEQLVYEFKPMLAEKNLTCSMDAPADVILSCDPDKLQRVFDNLLRNAVNYSYENSDIKVRAEINKNNVIIRFMNKGNVIPKEKLNRIFEQFYRLDSSRSSHNGGAGLGLAIAKEIVGLHNGEITAFSDEDITCFEVILPFLPIS